MMTPTHTSSGDLFFHCDPTAHRVIVTGEAGEVRYTFGRFGHQPGAFNTPLDAAVVRPAFFGEPPLADDPDTLWVAVADYGNRRIQIFEPDGVLVAVIDEDLIDAGIGAPSALTWREPVLEIEGVDGRKARIHLTAAMLSGGPAPATVPAQTPFLARAPRGFWERS
jgi:hypothetical protein